MIGSLDIQENVPAEEVFFWYVFFRGPSNVLGYSRKLVNG